MENQNQMGDRQVFNGQWTCAGCGAEITELPFEPDGTRDIFCRDCHRKKREGNQGNRGRQNQFGPRQMFQGNWKCSDCDTAITELPFEPSGEQPLLCRDCYRKKRGN